MTPAEQIRQEIEDVRKKIEDAIRDGQKQLRENCGLNMTEVKVDMLERTTMGDRFRQYEVGRVTISVNVQELQSK